ncbi:MAG TPA: LytTR family DNA-binding domain-containing protein [Bacteroidales bacterium]|nr:LytTR family DNA-binding domain-containing protein [Bacteroidales bacterium]
MIRVVIIDDEESAINNVRQILNLSQITVEIVGTAGSVEAGQKVVQETKPDLLLLDIELEDGTGFDLLDKLSYINFKLIFITASEEHALKAFRYSALDYIVKPINPEDLINTINKVFYSTRIENLELQVGVLMENLKELQKEPQTLVLKTSETVHLIQINEIIRCEAERNYTTFYLTNGDKILVSTTLKEYEKLLPVNNFVRVHNSHLVNISKIRKYEKHISGCLIMTDNSSVPVSARKKESLMHFLNKL